MTAADLTRHHIAVHPFVGDLEASDVVWMQARAVSVDYAASDAIFSAGEDADAFYLIRTGLVALRLGEDRVPGRVVQTVNEGGVLGWSWLYPPYQWQFTAQATAPVHMLQIATSDLLTAFADDPAFGYRFVARLAATMAERLHAARKQLIELSHG